MNKWTNELIAIRDYVIFDIKMIINIDSSRVVSEKTRLLDALSGE